MSNNQQANTKQVQQDTKVAVENKQAQELKVVADTNKAVDMQKLQDEEILKLEAEVKKKLEAIQAERANRYERIKANTLTSLKQAINKALTDYMLTADDLEKFLLDEKYVIIPEPTVIELVAAKKPKKEKVDGGSGKGRRAIADEDVLFAFNYVAENGRKQTLKFDAQSKMPAPASSSYKVLKDLQTKSFDELKQYFTPKFLNEFMLTEESIAWIDTLFPKLQDTIQTLANKAVKAQ